MSPTITKPPPTNGAVQDGEVAETVSAPELAGQGEDPPVAPRDSQASFAIFASAIAVLLSMASLIAVAFKLDDNQSSGAATGAPAGAAAAPAAGSTVGSLNVGLGDYFFSPQDATASAGKVKLSTVNTGQLPHELVLAKTNADPSQLPTKANGEVNEEKLNSPGEVPDVAAGTTKHGTVNLAPGRYVMFCNLPGHYAAGMYGTLTVN
jgi:uncharacterized cupredoxin-like copper-binding protein